MNQRFTTKSILKALFPDHYKGKDVYYQGSRQMTSTSRRYFERELGAGIGPSPGFNESFGYSEPLRRFIQREGFEPQANEIPNTMPSWMPGDDYYTNFRKGDPFIKVDQGFARLPGKGYESLHPELEGTNPEADKDRVRQPALHLCVHVAVLRAVAFVHKHIEPAMDQRRLALEIGGVELVNQGANQPGQRVSKLGHKLSPLGDAR